MKLVFARWQDLSLSTHSQTPGVCQHLGAVLQVQARHDLRHMVFDRAGA